MTVKDIIILFHLVSLKKNKKILNGIKVKKCHFCLVASVYKSEAHYLSLFGVFSLA